MSLARDTGSVYTDPCTWGCVPNIFDKILYLEPRGCHKSDFQSCRTTLIISWHSKKQSCLQYSTSLMPQTDQLNIKYKSPQCWAFSIGKTSWIENGSKQPLPVKILKAKGAKSRHISIKYQKIEFMQSYPHCLVYCCVYINNFTLGHVMKMLIHPLSFFYCALLQTSFFIFNIIYT